MQNLGHFGLNIVGDANIENCNGSSACCDNYNDALGVSSCTAQYACTSIGAINPTYVNGIGDREVPHNGPSGEKKVKSYEDLLSNAPGIVPKLPCGPALRLTTNRQHLTGAAWYSRQQEIREGFETTFTFRITNPSINCRFMDDVYTHCKSRGSDGFAFVIQAQSMYALGENGMGLGYQGIENSLAIEFDTTFNFELLEPYENHVSVHSGGWRKSNNASQTYSFGSSTAIPELTSGIPIQAKIVYKPVFDPSVLYTDNFYASAKLNEYLENADYYEGGQADFGTGLGMLYVHVYDMFEPKLITPINIDALLKLNHGRAFVGFTGATGSASYQVQDILDWEFTSYRQDPEYVPPVVVNEDGAHKCRGASCVHL